MEHTLTHELVHMYDHCKFDVDWNNLRHHACTEVCVAESFLIRPISAVYLSGKVLFPRPRLTRWLRIHLLPSPGCFWPPVALA